MKKSGFIALAAAILYADKLSNDNLVVNFTGRRPGSKKKIIPAKPNLFVNPNQDNISEIANTIKKKLGFL